MRKIIHLLTPRPDQIVGRNLRLKPRYIYLFAFLSICALLALYYLPINNNVKIPRKSMVLAAEKMKKATEAICNARRQRGLSINLANDPNRTGLVGRGDTEITTTLGDLEAKRTTTNPNFAALMVTFLKEVGVRKGDSVAIGASGSFPGAVIATLCAVEQIEAKPTIIYSLGSSMWGANLMNMTLLDMHQILVQEGILSFDIRAASIGGEKDIGSDLSEETRTSLIKKIKGSDAELVFSDSIQQSVKRRMDIYENTSKGNIKAFVNAGGAAANMGTSSRVLKLEPGVNNNIPQLPTPDKRGVIFSMAAQDVPIIHILNLKGLSLEYHLSWDPIPLPSPGEGKLFDERKNKPLLFWLLFFSYFGALVAGIYYRSWKTNNQ